MDELTPEWLLKRKNHNWFAWQLGFNSNRFVNKNIKFIIFELHYNLFNKLQIKNLMLTLKKSKFTLKDKCFNSFYFSKDL